MHEYLHSLAKYLGTRPGSIDFIKFNPDLTFVPFLSLLSASPTLPKFVSLLPVFASLPVGPGGGGMAVRAEGCGAPGIVADEEDDSVLKSEDLPTGPPGAALGSGVVAADKEKI